jgi:hypothetical protein
VVLGRVTKFEKIPTLLSPACFKMFLRKSVNSNLNVCILAKHTCLQARDAADAQPGSTGVLCKHLICSRVECLLLYCVFKDVHKTVSIWSCGCCSSHHYSYHADTDFRVMFIDLHY